LANPTTNYGFVLPTPTDLVTDLPADFEVALQGVDTQMFTNASAALSATIVDAKGDLIAATAADAVSRLAVGANKTVLTADSTTATGLKWAAGGMTLVKREPFSAVTDTSTTFDSLFTTTYDTYLIVMAVKGSSAGALFRFQFRKIAVTQAANYYGAAQELNFAGTASTILNNNTAQLEPCRLDTTNTFDLVMYVNGVGTGVSQSGYISGHSFEPSGLKTANFGGANITAGLYDGFILSAAAGTITGQVAVYGLAKS
jgi:hypothetical protein